LFVGCVLVLGQVGDDNLDWSLHSGQFVRGWDSGEVGDVVIEGGDPFEVRRAC
jgi:hypothetical protein